MNNIITKIKTGIRLWRNDKLGIFMPFFDKLQKNGICNSISDEKYLKIAYRLYVGKRLNLAHPISFTEKIQWLKLHDYKSEYDRLVDKYEVKDYIVEKIGEKYVIPTYGVWQRVEDIDWDNLPKKFVIKTTNGGGGHDVLICKDKESFDIPNAIRKLKSSFSRNCFWYGREYPYKNLKPRIMAEMLLDDPGNEIKDYKFFCFDGQVKYFKIDYGRYVEHHANYYDRNGILQPFGESGLLPDPSHNEIMPDNINDMISVAECLAHGFPFARIDLYNVKGEIYFGEITFYPASGLLPFVPKEWDDKLGKLIMAV